MIQHLARILRFIRRQPNDTDLDLSIAMNDAEREWLRSDEHADREWEMETVMREQYAATHFHDDWLPDDE